MAAISIFDIFKIGIGPSSSHTVGPMKAAAAFVGELQPVAEAVAQVAVTLHGSLAWTGKGHGTDSAILLGLCGLLPESIDPDAVDDVLAEIRQRQQINIPGIGPIPFDPAVDLQFDVAIRAAAAYQRHAFCGARFQRWRAAR